MGSSHTIDNHFESKFGNGKWLMKIGYVSADKITLLPKIKEEIGKLLAKNEDITEKDLL